MSTLDLRDTIVIQNKLIEKLFSAIRKHRDQRGDDRCWLDDEELYKVLPEGYEPPVRDSCVQLELCKKFIECRHNPSTIYISPQRRIEELEEENKKLKEKIERYEDGCYPWIPF